MEYAIVYRDSAGLFYNLREGIPRLPHTEIMAVFKGEEWDKAQEFTRNNKGKKLKPLTDNDISKLL